MVTKKLLPRKVIKYLSIDPLALTMLWLFPLGGSHKSAAGVEDYVAPAPTAAPFTYAALSYAIAASFAADLDVTRIKASKPSKRNQWQWEGVGFHMTRSRSLHCRRIRSQAEETPPPS